MNKSIYGFDNRQDDECNWVQSWSIKTAHGFTNNYTRLSTLWHAMHDRCKPMGFVQRRLPTYIGTRCDFIDYRNFSEWAVQQLGFDLIDDTGKRYALDKDILVKGNKIYSESTCAFVPQRLNNLLLLRASRSSSIPYGATWEEDRRKFKACISIDGRNKFLGRFESALDAHAAWQKRKSEELVAAVKWYEGCQGFNPAVAESILQRSKAIDMERADGVETTSI